MFLEGYKDTQQETGNSGCQWKGELDGCRQGLEAAISMDTQVHFDF